MFNDKKRKIGTVTKSVESLGIDRRMFYSKLTGRIEPKKFMRPSRRRLSALLSLKDDGNLKLALVSNSGRPLVTKLLEALEIPVSVFDAVVTSDEAEPKPSPDAYLLALRLARSPSRAAYVRTLNKKT